MLSCAVDVAVFYESLNARTNFPFLEQPNQISQVSLCWPNEREPSIRVDGKQSYVLQVFWAYHHFRVFILDLLIKIVY
jgi:hypothetical protein